MSFVHIFFFFFFFTFFRDRSGWFRFLLTWTTSSSSSSSPTTDRRYWHAALYFPVCLCITSYTNTDGECWSVICLCPLCGIAVCFHSFPFLYFQHINTYGLLLLLLLWGEEDEMKVSHVKGNWIIVSWQRTAVVGGVIRWPTDGRTVFRWGLEMTPYNQQQSRGRKTLTVRFMSNHFLSFFF